MPRAAIIGIDGVPYSLIKEMSDRHLMPNFQRLREEGAFTKMHSSIPEISSVSWSSIVTGKNPGEHGVYGFTDFIDGTYNLSFFNSTRLKAPPFWLSDYSKKYIIINVPATYPAQRINGLMVSGFVSPDLERAVYPRSYIDKLNELNYKIDVDAVKASKSRRLLFKELFAALESRMKALEYFWERIKWDVLMIVFTGSDRLGHFLWTAYEDESHESHTDFLKFFERVDQAIGEIDRRLPGDDSLMILSDHGMEQSQVEVNLNAYLVKEGLLTLKDKPDLKRRYDNIESETQAFVLEPGRVYLNRENRYPRGTVRERDEDELLENLSDLFYRLEKDGEKVIKKVHMRYDIYRGEYTKSAPDIVLLANSGFNLKPGLFKEELFEASLLEGKHTQEDAFLYVRKGNDSEFIPDKPSVEDVVPILNRLG